VNALTDVTISILRQWRTSSSGPLTTPICETSTRCSPPLKATCGIGITSSGRRHRSRKWKEPNEHLLAVDGARSFVAVDKGRVVGFTAALQRDDVWFFSALFVSPGHQGRGVGGELFERAWSDSARQRVTITDSIQPLSNSLYARHGLLPATPVLFLSGVSRADLPPCLVSRLTDTEALAAIDQAAYGFDRSPDHRFWLEHCNRAACWLRDGQPVGYAYTSDSGLVGPVAGIDPAAAAAVLQAELAQRQGQLTTVLIPGSARDLVATALGSGLRFARPPGLLLTTDDYRLPQALAISGYWLF
jgi:GNAT superfamily N-acetyltransferase